MSRGTSVETGVDSRVTGAAAGAEFRWLGGRVLETTAGFGRSLSPRMAGDQEFSPLKYRASPETSTPVEPEIDYEGLPQGVATSTHMLAGAVAGIMEHCLMYPIDCVKVSHESTHTTSFELFSITRSQRSHWLLKPPCRPSLNLGSIS